LLAVAGGTGRGFIGRELRAQCGRHHSRGDTNEMPASPESPQLGQTLIRRQPKWDGQGCWEPRRQGQKDEGVLRLPLAPPACAGEKERVWI